MSFIKVNFIITTVRNNNKTIYLHCNWGGETCTNGYYLSNILDPDATPYYNNDAKPTTRGGHFKYNLKTTTIW